jgi:hypothetical protein
VIQSAVLLVFAVAMGVALLWDPGGIAGRWRQGMERQAERAIVSQRIPAGWTLRAFGIWCVAFGIGQFIYFAVTLH